ncbi:CoA pyrophosphatase [Lujinxingia litoralis]|uniref:CoA pyrophosphatase n=1 Tax=Lujinxingia litoralis TaxID=2211119 RepID=A0A328C4W0_9DELT|nr:CoA pyrophosphatase [Lujinxingia litoralis]RAL20791.1 CoA pyrophosphatase [Lujinxingia litoralis]
MSWALSPERVRQKLQALSWEPQVNFERVPGLEGRQLRQAAVLAPLTQVGGELHLVFTERPSTMREHSGEVAFPGGRRDPEDRRLRDTALREAHEEIGLMPEDVRLYGSLVRMPTISGYEVTTFVGEFAHPYELNPNPGEIEEMFLVPLAHLADPACQRVEQRSWDGVAYDLHFYDVAGHTIWGATGYMVSVLLDFLAGRPLDQGRWTRE